MQFAVNDNNGHNYAPFKDGLRVIGFFGGRGRFRVISARLSVAGNTGTILAEQPSAVCRELQSRLAPPLPQGFGAAQRRQGFTIVK